MSRIVFHPADVSAWGHAGRHAGHLVRSAGSHIGKAEDDAGRARAHGLASLAALSTYTATIGRGIGHVADDVSGVGDKLVSTASIIRQSDDASVDEFGQVPMPVGHGLVP